MRVIPVGAVFWYAKNDVPNGFLKCDGSQVSRTLYADLFGVIGTVFGTGDILGSGGGAYARNDYESPAYQGGVNGASGAGGWTTNQYGINGITWGSGGGPGNIVSATVGNVTCSSGAGKSGIIIIRKAVV